MAFEFQTWRCSHAYPGEAVYVFSSRGLAGQAPMTLPARWQYRGTPARYNNSPSWLENWVRAVGVPADAAPGIYPVTWKSGDSGPYTAQVTVVARSPEAPVVRLPLDSTAAEISAAFNAGNRTVRLEPGCYYLETPIAVKGAVGPVTLDGEGVVRVVRRPEGKYQWDRFIDLSAGNATVSVKGITFVGTGHQNAVYHGWPVEVRRLDVTDCAFENCTMISWGLLDDGPKLSSMLVRNCRFRQRAGTGLLPAGASVEWCEFEGGSAVGEHAYHNQGQRRVLTMNCDWHRTSRGWVNQGGVQGCLAVGCRFFHVAKGEVDGGECLLFEGGFHDDIDAGFNAAVACHAFGCTGPGLVLYGNGIHDNTFTDLTLGCRGVSIYLAQLDPAKRPVADNLIEHAECDGTIFLTGKVTRNKFQGVTVRNLPASCGNQPAFNGYAPGSPDSFTTFRGAEGFPVLDNSAAKDNLFRGLAVAGVRGKKFWDKPAGSDAWAPKP